jgi:hypothetical protein
MTPRVFAAAIILFLVTLGGFYFHPGHAFLTSDTQIYLPILDRLSDPSLFPKDPVALHAHVAYTIYDEITVLLRWASGLPFESVLQFQQVIFRFCGLFGVFLIGYRLQLTTRMSILLASIYGLGGFIGGPSVMLLEVEPVPRGFAGPLLVLAMGFLCFHRYLLAGLVAAIAFLYHPPTAVPFLVVFSIVVLWPGISELKRPVALLPIGCAIAFLLLLSRFQPGVSEPQQFFGIIDPQLEKLQRLRGSYNWISMWAAPYLRNHEFLWAVTLLATARFWRIGTPETRSLAIGLPVFGIVMLPVSYLLLEVCKWTLMPQYQPARAVLFVTEMCGIIAGICGLLAARDRRVVESLGWLIVAYAIPMQSDVLSLVFPDLRDESTRTRFFVVLAMAALTYLAVRWHLWHPFRTIPLVLAALVLPWYLVRQAGNVRNYPLLDHPEIHDVARWARTSTPKDAVFLFPDAGQDLQPGIFRAYSQRGLYVDWKGGGQVNLLRGFGLEWWRRWQETGEGSFKPENLAKLKSLDIDYIVVKPANRLAAPPSFENSRYVVFKLR